MSYSNVPPPNCLQRRDPKINYEKDEESLKKYDELNKKSRAGGSKRPGEDNSDDEYFNDDEITNEPSSSKKKSEEEDEVDELDLFMAEINQIATKEIKESESRSKDVDVTKGGQGRDDIDQEDMQESYFKFMEEYKERHPEEDEDNYEYDEDGNIIWTWKKVIDPLPKMDHSTVKYEDFKADFYNEHEQILGLTAKEVFDLRNSLDIRVFGLAPPKPCTSFAHFNLEESLMNRIRKANFETPTPIQAQGIPVALLGRDLLGLAKTGSGKTLVYVLPALTHVLGQSYPKSSKKGPIVVVIVPTRELALQVYNEFKFYSKDLDFSLVCAYGGGNKYEQEKALKAGCHIVVATPGRLIDVVKDGAMNFERTSFLVFDEADRMFDLGFETQVKSISDHVRSDRQCLMFSATFPPKIEKLTSHALSNPIKVLCGDVTEANADIIQTVHILPDLETKLQWLYSNIVAFCTQGKVIVFVTKKLDAEIVADKLKQRNIQLVLLHGDMSQFERNDRLKAFRGDLPCLVATDVAARGLDIPDIKNVVNFDVARDLDTHIHRIGRTGRAGIRGNAFSLLTQEDKEFAGPLMANLENSGQEVSQSLKDLVKSSKWFAEHGEPDQRQRRVRTGLGFSEAKPVHSSGDIATSLAKPTAPKKNLDQMLNKAKAVAESSTGLGMSRYHTMRHALKSSYQGMFTKASSDEAPSVAFTDPTPSRLQNQPEQPAKKKSRWG